jgi:F420-dependent oxidoreductase-like protein
MVDIGVYIGDATGPATVEETISQARRAASSRIRTVWAAQALGWDSLTLLAVVGAAVPGIGLGTAVVPTPQRHPLVLASQALTVQAAVGGRLTLGIGAGVGVMVEGMFGLPHDRPARRLREYLTVLEPILRREAVAHHGEALTAVGQVRLPRMQPPQVLLAALRPAMLQIAGELADGTVTWMTGPRTLAEHIVPTISRAAQTSGRGSPRIVAGILACTTDDANGARSRIASSYEMAGQVPEYRSVLDREGAAGPADVALIGDEATVARGLRRFADAGVTELAVAPFGTADEQARTLAVLADLEPRRSALRHGPISADDRIAIHELIASHGHIADDRRPEDLNLLLTTDAVYDISSYGFGTVEGLPAIQELFSQRPGTQPVGHHVTNVILHDRTDGTVSVRSKGIAIMADGTAGSCIYDDTVTRTDNGWRISRRRISTPDTT